MKKIILMLSYIVICWLMLSMPMTLMAETSRNEPGFHEYIDQLKQEALLKGFPITLIEQTFSNVEYHPRIVQSDKNQPEKKLTLSEYLERVVTEKRLQHAMLQQKEQSAILTNVSKLYRVQPAYILALWGLESNFGEIQGKENIISSLATLAFDGRREEFFKEQLFILLDLLDRKIISTKNLLGSWAGAMGQAQFMPSSLLKYGVDMDKDGLIDIWNNNYDVLGSIANYLNTEGWNDKIGWGIPVTLSHSLPENIFGTEEGQQKSGRQWLELGIKTNHKLTRAELNQAGWLIQVYDTPERYFLVNNNFRVLMHWNRSYFFALSVGLLADKIQHFSDEK